MADTRLTQRYIDEKKSLNLEQLRAVETIEGPVMVLAGPGTGKTQILAFRIAEILLQTDATPRNILALTFTESGVAAMRERLVSLIGPTAYGVGIYTFHSFANRVIMESGAEFYRTHTLNQIDDITQLKLVMELLDQTESELLRPPRSPYFYVKPIIHSIRSLKSEGVSPADLTTLCRASIEDLQNDPASISKAGKTKGDLKQTVKDKIQQFERTIVFAEVYAAYEAACEDRGYYDYEDMILFVVRTLAENQDLKARYQEQFRYILVDEYQDTNNAQNTLVRLLSDYFENPNVFVVGDDKQSIYRFQGASTANLLDFRQWYPETVFISLKENYRSGQPILDAADMLIQNNTEQLAKVIPDIQTELHAQTPTAAVQLTTYATVDQEIGGIVASIKQLIDQGVNPSDIAIIYRQNSEAAALSEALAKQSIAFQLEAGDDLLRDGDIHHLLHLLTLTDNPNNDGAFFHLIHASYSNVPTGDLIKISRWAREQRTGWQKVLDGDKPEIISQEAWDVLLAWREKINEWYRYQTSHTVTETVEYVLLQSGFLNSLLQHPNHLQRLHRIRVFFDDVKCLAETNNFPQLKDLFARLEIRQRYNLPLIARPLIEASTQAVRLMTAHKSKGLEFTYVFIPGVTSDRWGVGKGMQSLRLPDGIVSHHQTTDEQDIEEERRLFYVALTRAKQQVTVSYAELTGENRKQTPSQFITEIDSFTHVPSSVSTTLLLQNYFSPISDAFMTETTQNYLKEIVTKHPLTPTGLNSYLMCPMEYLYRDIYCIPGIRGVDEAYGTAMHKALEMWGSWSKNDGIMVSLSSVLSVFYECLGKESLIEAELYRYRKLGESVLTAYYEQFHAQWVTPLATEYSFTPHKVVLNGSIPITGKIDRIEPIPGSKAVRLVDYKTGRVRSRNDIEGKTASSDGDYKRQLVFYTVLAECDPFFPYTVGEVAISFIDDAMKFTTESFTITQEEKQEVKELITNVYNEMQLLHFDHTPHKRAYGHGESLCDILRNQV